MRFPLKLALSAILAKQIVADHVQLSQSQQLPNERVLTSFQPQQFEVSCFILSSVIVQVFELKCL